MPQLGPAAWDFPLTALDVALQGGYRRTGWLRRPGAASGARRATRSRRWAWPDIAGRQIGQLSGGQRQRVLLARTLVQDAPLLLLDEPLSGADAATEAAFLETLRRLREQGRTMVVSTHDLGWSAQHCDLLCLLPGRVISYGPPARRSAPSGWPRPTAAPCWTWAASASWRRRATTPLMHYLTDPLQFEFMRRALVAVVLTGIAAGVLGSYVVLRGLAFIGDALTHAVFPGIVVAVAIGRSILLGALVVGLLTALGIAAISRSRRVCEDTAIGILFAAMFALGVVLVSTLAAYQRDVADLLFGQILAVSHTDLVPGGRARRRSRWWQRCCSTRSSR